MKSTSDLFNEIIPLGRLIHMVNQNEQCHQLVGQDLHQELTKNLTADEVATLEHLLKKVLP
ncbi:hypothetical protein [Escherichia coli]|uniref:hypothetical protein n=1 Tax=Escherichia coli TaxID=562 RepID=UPI001C530359|nr:hypothetical protein [Escherichia coli]MBW1190038.1 hypothetical protein [Escherichia coli]